MSKIPGLYFDIGKKARGYTTVVSLHIHLDFLEMLIVYDMTWTFSFYF